MGTGFQCGSLLPARSVARQVGFHILRDERLLGVDDRQVRNLRREMKILFQFVQFETGAAVWRSAVYKIKISISTINDVHISTANCKITNFGKNNMNSLPCRQLCSGQRVCPNQSKSDDR